MQSEFNQLYNIVPSLTFRDFCIKTKQAIDINLNKNLDKIIPILQQNFNPEIPISYTKNRIKLSNYISDLINPASNEIIFIQRDNVIVKYEAFEMTVDNIILDFTFLPKFKKKYSYYYHKILALLKSTNKELNLIFPIEYIDIDDFLEYDYQEEIDSLQISKEEKIYRTEDARKLILEIELLENNELHEELDNNQIEPKLELFLKELEIMLKEIETSFHSEELLREIIQETNDLSDEEISELEVYQINTKLRINILKNKEVAQEIIDISNSYCCYDNAIAATIINFNGILNHSTIEQTKDFINTKIINPEIFLLKFIELLKEINDEYNT